jgi:hypothetical protein
MTDDSPHRKKNIKDGFLQSLGPPSPCWSLSGHEAGIQPEANDSDTIVATGLHKQQEKDDKMYDIIPDSEDEIVDDIQEAKERENNETLQPLTHSTPNYAFPSKSDTHFDLQQPSTPQDLPDITQEPMPSRTDTAYHIPSKYKSPDAKMPVSSASILSPKQSAIFQSYLQRVKKVSTSANLIVDNDEAFERDLLEDDISTRDVFHEEPPAAMDNIELEMENEAGGVDGKYYQNEYDI